MSWTSFSFVPVIENVSTRTVMVSPMAWVLMSLLNESISVIFCPSMDLMISPGTEYPLS